jgi:phospholipase C
MEICQATYPKSQPPVPYNSAQGMPSTEQGFKSVRGQLTEGRFLTFEMNGFAITLPAGATSLSATPVTAKHDDIAQRWTLNQLASGGNAFNIVSVPNGRYMVNITITDMGNGAGYSLQFGGQYLTVCGGNAVCVVTKPAGFDIFSVTYS